LFIPRSYPVITWRDLEISLETSIRGTDNLVGIRTQHLPSTSLERYGHTNMLGLIT